MNNCLSLNGKAVSACLRKFVELNIRIRIYRDKEIVIIYNKCANSSVLYDMNSTNNFLHCITIIDYL